MKLGIRVMKPILKLSAFLLSIVLVLFISCKKELSCKNCETNQPPIANAGTDQIITSPKDSVTLDASASTDPDGTITSYKWKKFLGPGSSSIIDSKSSTTLVKTLVIGVYKFELTVTDNGGLSARDTVQVIVNGPTNNQTSNQSPIANAGPDQTLTLPLDSAYLDGSGSSPNGWSTTHATFQWTKISGPSQFSISPATFLDKSSFLPTTTAIAKNLIPGTYSFRLEVTEGSGASSADTVQVTVVNDPLDKNTVTFHNLTWMTGDVYGLAEIDNFLNTSLRLDLFFSNRKVKPLEVYFNFNTAPAWISVPFRNGGLYYDGFGEFLWIVKYPVDPLLAGRKSSIKIKLL
jgi:hypothetical protein